MRKLKTLSIMLITLSMLLLSACGGAGGTTEGAKQPEKQEAQSQGNEEKKEETKKEEPSAVQEPEKKELPAFDMGGEPVKFMAWGGLPKEGESNAGDERLKRMKEMEKKYNTKIEWIVVPWGEGQSKIAAGALSGEAPADFVLMNMYLAFPSLAEKGYLRTVDDVFNFDDPKWPSSLRRSGAYKDKVYGVVENIDSGAGMYYNRTMLKKLGLTDPHDLVKKDEWNWDHFKEMAKKATQDLNGDGKIDQWGIVSYAPIFSRQAIYSNNGSIVETKDDKLTFTMGEPNAMEALRFVYDLFATDKVIMPNKNGSMADYEDTQAMFNTGKALFVTGEIWEAWGRKDMADEFGYVYFPKGPKGTDYASPNPGMAMWFMPANVKKAKEKAQIYEDWILWDKLKDNQRESNESVFQTPEDVDAAMDIPTKNITLYHDGIGDVGKMYNEAIVSFTKGKDTPESAVEKMKKPAQNIIDSVVNTK